MKLVASIEKWMADIMRGLPQLSKENKDILVKAWPWVALIFGILQLLSVLGLLSFLRQAQQWSILSNYAGYHVSALDTTMVYVNIALLALTAILLLLAYAPLKARARRGWELLFIVGLINLASGLVSLFITGRGIGSFIFSLVISAIVFYLLIQVRDQYKGKGIEASVKEAKKSEGKDKKAKK